MNHQNPCHGQEEEIYRYFDGELSDTELGTFEIHLAECEVCQTLLGEIETLYADFSALEEISAPPEIASRVMHALPKPQTYTTTQPDSSVWIFITQGIFGVILLTMTVPKMLLPLQWHFTLPQWTFPTFDAAQIWATRLEIPAGWLSVWVQNIWAKLADVSLLTLSPTLTIGIIAALGVAWLFSNRLLLNPSHHSMKNGGSI